MKIYSSKIVLCSSALASLDLSAFVEACITSNVQLICVFGENCEEIEHQIDDFICFGGDADESRYICTSSHPGESLEDVIEFARGWTSPEGEPQLFQ